MNDPVWSSASDFCMLERNKKLISSPSLSQGLDGRNSTQMVQMKKF